MRTQKASKQISTLESVTNSVKLLNEMLAHFSTEDSTEGDKEIIRVSMCIILMNFGVYEFLKHKQFLL